MRPVRQRPGRGDGFAAPLLLIARVGPMPPGWISPPPPRPNVAGLAVASFLFFVAAGLLALAPETFFCALSGGSALMGLLLWTRKKAALVLALVYAILGFLLGMAAAIALDSHEIETHLSVVGAVLVSMMIIAILSTKGVRAVFQPRPAFVTAGPVPMGGVPQMGVAPGPPVPGPWPAPPHPLMTPVPPPVPPPTPATPVEAAPPMVAAPAPAPSGPRGDSPAPPSPPPAPPTAESRHQTRERLSARLQALTGQFSALGAKRTPDQREMDQTQKALLSARRHIEEEQYHPDAKALEAASNDLDTSESLLTTITRNGETRAQLTQEIAELEKMLIALARWSTAEQAAVKNEIQTARTALRSNDFDTCRSRLAAGTEVLNAAEAASVPKISISPDLKAFTKGRWEDYVVGLSNTGTAQAAEVRPELEIEDTRTKPLAEGKTFKVNAGETIEVRIPVNFGADGSVPLTIRVAWQDRKGHPFDATREHRAKVGPG